MTTDNISFNISEMLFKLGLLLEKTQWRSQLGNPYNYTYIGNSSYFILKPDILTYKENDILVNKIWFKLEKMAFTNMSKFELFNVCKPFDDITYRGFPYWINPFYPNGLSISNVLTTY